MKKRKCPCRETKNQSCLWSARAFTCLELLVVLGVLSVLAVVMAPALARTRPNSNAAQCLANLRQLATAWTMYVDDSRGVLPPNRDGGNAGKSPFDACWVGGWLDFTSSTDNTNVALLVNHQQNPYAAYLGPYVKTASLFKCPSDRSKAYYGGVEMVPRTRTVSMNSRVGTLTRSWAGSDNYRLYTTVSSMAAPKPSDLFVLCDEREDSINDGCFQVDPATPGAIIDFPGAYHECAGSFGFVDGHVELRRWQDPRTVPLLVPGQYIVLNVNFAKDPDVEWIQQHSSARK